MILEITPRHTDRSISFEKGGAFFLKNDHFSIMLSCFPIGQNGKGGHNHLDFGSLTFSYAGNSILVDPGTYCYTRSKRKRDEYRSYNSHNMAIPDSLIYHLNEIAYWELKNFNVIKSKKIEEGKLIIHFQFLITGLIWIREIEFNLNSIVISDSIKGKFKTLFHFHPSRSNFRIEKGTIYSDFMSIKLSTLNYSLRKYNYSSNYGSEEKAIKLQINGVDNIICNLNFDKCSR